MDEPEFQFTAFLIPADAGRRVWLAKFLLASIDPSAELFIQIDDWSVWPSGQHMPLFERFREAFGERRALIDAPGHVLSASKRDDATSILVVSMLYLWDCYVLSGRGDEATFVSHDEYGWYAARDPARVREIEQQLRETGVSPLNKPEA